MLGLKAAQVVQKPKQTAGEQKSEPARRICPRKQPWPWDGGLAQLRTSSAEFVEQRPGVLEVGGIEALDEPAVDRSQEVMGLGAFALIGPQPGEAGGAA